MYELPLEKAEIKTIKDHQYYVFPKPTPHANQTDRPTTYADVKALKPYVGKGSKGTASPRRWRSLGPRWHCHDCRAFVAQYTAVIGG